MKYAKWLIISGIICILTFTVLVFATVFSVSDTQVDYLVYTGEDFAKVEEIMSSYKGKNLLFINTDEIAEKIVRETSLKVSSVSKKYPYTLTASVFAREERFAVSSGDGNYYILDDEYTVLKLRDTCVNPSDDLSDILLNFETSDKPVLTVKNPFYMENEVLFGALKSAVSCFSSPRDMIEYITLRETEEKGNYRINIGLRSGVVITVFKAASNTALKVEKGMQKYAQLKDGDLLSGVIECYEKDSGEIVAVYTRMSAN